MNNYIEYNQDNCPFKLDQFIQFPPATGVPDKGKNVLHFNTIDRPYQLNESAKNFIQNKFMVFDHDKGIIDKTKESDAETLLYAVQLAKKNREFCDDPGIYLEFGFCSGRSLNFLAALAYDTIIYGFDSGLGLPEDWRPKFPKGTFRFTNRVASYNEREIIIRKADKDEQGENLFIPFVPLVNAVMILGLISDTLPEFIKRHMTGRHIELIHIDTDLYSSAENIYNYLGEFIIPNRTIIVLDEGYNFSTYEDGTGKDEWKDHEIKATQKFAESRKWRINYLAYNKNHQQIVLNFSQT